MRENRANLMQNARNRAAIADLPLGKRNISLYNRDIIVIGASTGGVEALCTVVKGLPKSLRASVFVVMHVGDTSILSHILGRCGKMPVSEGREDVAIRRGHLYVAPPNRHMVMTDGHVTLTHAPRENGHRPAVDPLFRSAARLYRNRVIGVILTGALDDGSAGLFAISNRGGTTIVQDPEDALEPGMPRNALHYVDVDYCLPVGEIGPTLVKLCKKPLREKSAPARASKNEPGTIDETNPGFREDALSFVCPECQGPLYETREGQLVKFNCQVGHSFSPESLSAAHNEALERALWIAVRTLNERVAINEALATRNKRANNDKMAQRMTEAAASAALDVKMIREILDRL